eukprot:3009574-Pyramimonas_sp.AAC.1
MPFLCGLPVTGDGHAAPLHTGFRDTPADDSAHFFELFNGNCRATLLERLRASNTLIVCAQEIGTAEAAAPGLQRAARAIGYRMLRSPSFERDRGSHSAGAAVFVRLELGLRWNPTGGEICRGRLISAQVDIPGWPELT